MPVEGEHLALNTASVSLLGINPHNPDRRTIELWNEAPLPTPGLDMNLRSYPLTLNLEFGLATAEAR
ncbi:MAG: hypothetical protein H7337_02345 [Rhizobacter sp.]|nr:hypothetical protein [Rhizobacter sp.]